MKIGLVLSGGGVRGAAHIGAIKALEEYGIFPTHVAGASAGAIVGALYAYGYSWQEMLKFFKEVTLLDIKKYALNKPGFLDTEKFYTDFNKYLKQDNFKYLKKKLSVTTTNILEGRLEVFNTGELIKPVLASAAFPGVFAPIKIKDSYYIDGGTLNNFPVEAVKESCDMVIGVYVNPIKELQIKDLKHSYNVVEHAFKIKSAKEDELKFAHCDLVISPEALFSYGTFDKKNIDAIFKLGYETAVEAIESSKFKTFKKPVDNIEFE